MSKVAVIGGSGFVGTRLIDILKENNEVINVDKQQSHFHSDITVIGNVLDVESIEKHLKGVDIVVLLAAEHRDDVSPTQKYYDVNVEGARNVLKAMDNACVKRITFASSVAVYGLNKVNPNEEHVADPFNHYGKSKWQAEEVLRKWYNEGSGKNLTIIRPTVIFGERNRGNVYNLLKQISSGRFMMIGKCENKKSMAYVGNIVGLMKFCIDTKTKGYDVFNYVDKPDFSMNQLVSHVGVVLKKSIPSIRIPYAIGMLGGYGFDAIAFITRKKLSISSVRVKKFCATTQFDATHVLDSGYKPLFSLAEGLERTLIFEFVKSGHEKDDVVFISE